MMLKEGAHLTPPKAAITFLRNDQDHFDALRVTCVTLDEILMLCFSLG